MTMKRYNQGFYKFGTMEQSNDGEWVKYEDVIADIERRERNYNDLFHTWDRTLDELGCVKESNKELLQVLAETKKDKHDIIRSYSKEIDGLKLNFNTKTHFYLLTYIISICVMALL